MTAEEIAFALRNRNVEQRREVVEEGMKLAAQTAGEEPVDPPKKTEVIGEKNAPPVAVSATSSITTPTAKTPRSGFRKGKVRNAQKD